MSIADIGVAVCFGVVAWISTNAHNAALDGLCCGVFLTSGVIALCRRFSK